MRIAKLEIQRIQNPESRIQEMKDIEAEGKMQEKENFEFRIANFEFKGRESGDRRKKIADLGKAENTGSRIQNPGGTDGMVEY